MNYEEYQAACAKAAQNFQDEMTQVWEDYLARLEAAHSSFRYGEEKATSREVRDKS